MALHEIDPAVFRGPLTWLVVVRQAPFYVRESPGERAWQTFILERETELLLGIELATDASLAVAVKLVGEALVEPKAGPRRRPARFVVEAADLGALLSAKFGIKVEVSGGKLPEADQFLKEMKQFLDAGGGRESRRAADERSEQPSYFDGGIPPSLIHDLIKRGSALSKLRPWDRFPNSQLIRLDVPEMGVREAGVCVIGEMGESRSILVFRSRDDYMVHLGRGERLANQPAFSVEPIHPGVPLLALDFELSDDFPARMKDEAAAMGLKPGRKALYPDILCVDPDGVRRPTTERDVRLILAVAAVLTDAFRQFGSRLGDPDSWPICTESRVGESGVARLTVPFEADGLFGVDEARPSKSGDAAVAQEPSADKEAALIEAMTLLMIAAETQFKDAAREIDRALRKDDGDTLAAPWALFHRVSKGMSVTVAEALLRGRIGSLKARKWMEAQGRSWITAWHIADSSNHQFSCRDLITGEFRVFVDADPRTRGRLAQGDVFIGRIVDFAAGPSIFGAGAYTLPLRSANAVVESVRRALKTAQVTPEILRGHRGGFVVQREWNKVASARRVR